MPDINGTSGNDILVGTSGPDVIRGFEGNDTITGGGGNDIIYGGLGNNDIAVFSGNRGDYVIITGPLFSSVTDQNMADGDDGMDQVWNIELPLILRLEKQAEAITLKRQSDIVHLDNLVDQNGLRPAARLLGIDPSNLRRLLRARRS